MGGLQKQTYRVLPEKSCESENAVCAIYSLAGWFLPDLDAEGRISLGSDPRKHSRVRGSRLESRRK